MTITGLYKKITAGYTHDNLQKITRKIIELHRNKQTNALAMMVNALGKEKQTGAKAFYTLMMTYHPDRLNVYRSEIDALYAANKYDELKQYAHILTALELESTLVVLKRPPAASPAYNDLWETVREESERYDEEEFEAESEDGYGGEFEDETPRNNFFTAFKRLAYGNAKIELPFYYLEDLETLDLAGNEIDDLDGIRHCKHLVSLDLTSNLITDISELASLTMLRELYLAGNRIGYIDGLGFLKNLRAVDISFNTIDDLSPLFGLEQLEYVNAAGNRIPPKQIDTLQKKGIVIII